MYSNFTVIDFETTGLAPKENEIIEFGAVRVRDGEIVAQYSQLADPGRSIPTEIAQLTGIHPNDLSGMPRSEEVLQEFLRFLDDEPFIVAHHAKFEADFLKAKGQEISEERFLDTLVFSRILWPELAHHDLQSLGEYFGRITERAHRATADAKLTAEVWLEIIAAADKLHPAVVATIHDLLLHTKTSVGIFFDSLNKKMENEVMIRSGGTYESLFDDFTKWLDRLKDKTTLETSKAIKPLDSERMAQLFSESGVFAHRFPDFEHRTEQVEMVRSVCETLNQGEHALIEAGTGTGKTMAYLAPAIGWAITNKEKVVISTNTRNLQDQLFEKDIPEIKKALKKSFTAVRLKGASNYLCVRKFMQLLKQPSLDLSNSDRIALAALAVWAAHTENGDMGQCNGFNNLGGRELKQRLGMGGNECMSGACRQGRRCFLHKARGQAMDADLIVVNHALVFTEVGLENSILPSYSTIVFDEAHNIENVITENLTRNVNRYRFTQLLNRIHQEDAKGSSRGILNSLDFQLKRYAQAFPKGKDSDLACKESVDLLLNYVEEIRKYADSFFDVVAGLYSSGAENNKRGSEIRQKQARQRFSNSTQEGDAWKEILLQKERFSSMLFPFIADLNKLKEKLERFEEKDVIRRSALEELQWRIDELTEFLDDVEFVVSSEDENYVYWTNRETRQRNTDYSLRAAPIDVGPLMRTHFLETKSSVVFVSATLSVGGSFDFFKQRVGLELSEDRSCNELLLGSCFDFDSHALLAVPSFLPEPGYRQKDFDIQLGDLLIDTFSITGGRGLVLCTSYEMLGNLHRQLEKALKIQSIPVLGQGISGETRQISQIFKCDNKSVLIGTQSFWEGFDAPGQTLICVVVAKLPFPVFSDPIVEARCELLESKGLNSFMSYMVPCAAIRLKQGFGRLIRTKNDFGVILLGDKRVLTKRYGSALLKSLPVGHHEYKQRGEFLSDLQTFLKERDSDARES